MSCDLLFALASTGKSIAANMAMMAMTTSSSINVKASQSAQSLGLHTDLRILMAAQGQAGRGEVEAVGLARIVSSPIHVPEDLLFILLPFCFRSSWPQFWVLSFSATWWRLLGQKYLLMRR